MDEITDLDVVAREVLGLLRRHGLNPDSYGITLTVPRKDFERLAERYPGQHPRLILITASAGGLQWYVQVSPKRELEDFPPGAILPPPSYDK